MMKSSNRIKYDDARCVWRVIFEGKELDFAFKTSLEAYAHLQTLINPPAKKTP